PDTGLPNGREMARRGRWSAAGWRRNPAWSFDGSSLPGHAPAPSVAPAIHPPQEGRRAPASPCGEQRRAQPDDAEHQDQQEQAHQQQMMIVGKPVAHNRVKLARLAYKSDWDRDRPEYRPARCAYMRHLYFRRCYRMTSICFGLPAIAAAAFDSDGPGAGT